MTMFEEIEEHAETATEAPLDENKPPLTAKQRITKFSSGQDSWYSESKIADRAALIDLAKKGDVKAKHTLMNHPHNIKTLVLGGKEIIK